LFLRVKTNKTTITQLKAKKSFFKKYILTFQMRKNKSLSFFV
jgi:hypothetical protein